MADADLVEKIDQQFSLTPADWRLLLAQAYRDELSRRENSRLNGSMLAYTREVRDYTRIMLGATLVSLVLGVVSVEGSWIFR